jgi:hypothetical protein
MDEQLDEGFTMSEDTSVVKKKKRPTFLLVLCILTFVASGFGVIMGLVNLTGVNDVESAMRNASVGADPFSQSFLDGIDIEGMQKIQDLVNILSLVASVLCLAGALIMFNLKKLGFVPYVLGQAAAIYSAYLSVGLFQKMSDAFPVQAMGDMMSMMGGFTLVFSIIIAIGFIIMYGVNLKHLK